MGSDMRLSSPQLAAALLRGIIDQGTNAIDLGMVTTDGLYFAVGAFDYPAGVMITASHNPGQYNGMKFCRAKAFPSAWTRVWMLFATWRSEETFPHLFTPGR